MLLLVSSSIASATGTMLPHEKTASPSALPLAWRCALGLMLLFRLLAFPIWVYQGKTLRQGHHSKDDQMPLGSMRSWAKQHSPEGLANATGCQEPGSLLLPGKDLATIKLGTPRAAKVSETVESETGRLKQALAISTSSLFPKSPRTQIVGLQGPNTII